MSLKLNKLQAVRLGSLYLIGASLITGVNTIARQDSWLSLVISAVLALPLFMIFARIQTIFRGRNLFGILELTFGKIIGKVVIALYTLYVCILGGLSLRSFSEFVTTTSLNGTPNVVLMIVFAVLCVYLAKSNIMGRAAYNILPFVLAMLFLPMLAAIPKYNVSHLLPVFASGYGNIMRGGVAGLLMPFGELVLFMAVLSGLDKDVSIYKVYRKAHLVTFAVLMLILLNNLMVLGTNVMEHIAYPNYAAARAIDVSGVLERVESTQTVSLELALVAKGAVCIWVGSLGAAHLAGTESNRALCVPAALLCVAIGGAAVKNGLQVTKLITDGIQPVSVIMQVLLPVLIWIVSEIRKSKIAINVESQAPSENTPAS